MYAISQLVFGIGIGGECVPLPVLSFVSCAVPAMLAYGSGRWQLRSSDSLDDLALLCSPHDGHDSPSHSRTCMRCCYSTLDASSILGTSTCAPR